MQVWIDLVVRELAFVTPVSALGAGPAAFLPARFDRTARWTIAPALGLSVGVCLTVTIAWEYAAHETGWLVIAAAALSLAVAVWRRPPHLTAPRPRNVLMVAIVAAVVLGGFDYPLASRGTVGPVGGYQIADTSGYVSETDGVERDSMRTARHLVGAPYSDLSTVAWTNYAVGTQQIDVAALEAHVNSVLGLGATDTQAPFLIAILLVAALGVFATVRVSHPGGSWPAVLAGSLLAGPLFVELVMEGSQAAIAGSALIAPTVLLGMEALRRRSASNLILFALVLAGLQTTYPLFVPCVVIGTALALTIVAARALRAGRLPARGGTVAGGQLAVVAALAIVLTPVAFSRNLHYWLSILRGHLTFAGLPPYRLPLGTLPGYVLQTREFFGLVNVLDHGTEGQLLLAGAVPLALLAVAAFAVARTRVALAALGVAAGCALLAYYTWRSDGCGYCVQRNVLPMGSLAAIALGLGLAVLAALNRPAAVRVGGTISPSAAAATLIALVIVLVVGHEGVVLRQRLVHSDYMLDQENRRALGHLPSSSGPLELEGFTANVQAPMELPLVYDLAEERTHGNVSYPTIGDDNNGLAYLTAGSAPLGPSFRANYEYVLTRLAGISSGRRTIARYGPIALQRRIGPLDVTVIGGVAAAPARQDPTGTAWVNSALPVRFLVLGGHAGQPAWILLRLRRTVAVTVPRAAGLFVSHDGPELEICLRASGTAPIRFASVMPAFTPTPPPPPANRYDQPLPPRGLQLQAMTVSSRSCAH